MYHMLNTYIKSSFLIIVLNFLYPFLSTWSDKLWEGVLISHYDYEYGSIFLCVY